MAVLKILVSAALLGTFARCQDIYSAYNSGGNSGSSGIGQYSPSILSRGTPRLVPVKTGQPLQYHTAATSAPVVLKRGRVLAAPSPYSLESASATSSGSTFGSLQYAQNIPTASSFRPSPPQISASPVHHQAHHAALQPQQQQYPQPTYYIQKGPVVVGPGRPVKVAKAKKPLPPPISDAEAAEEEEYPGDPNPQYNFSFDIKDDELTNYQNRQEERDGQTIKGSYSVVDPDGYVRTVTYTASPKSGFIAKVTREPTDVKIKFPVPTQAPEAAQPTQNAGPTRRGQAYQPQYQTQYQPQAQYHQASAYATPQQIYAVQPQQQDQVQPRYVARTASRFAIQPQASGSSPRARIVRRARRPSPPTVTPSEQQEQEQE